MNFKTILALALLYMVLGPLALWLEAMLSDCDLIIATRGIIGIATVFFALTLGELFIEDRYRRTQPKALLGVYMGAKGIRFFVTLIAVVAYGVLHAPGLITFSINIFLFFIATVVFTTYINMREEKKINQQ